MKRYVYVIMNVAYDATILEAATTKSEDFSKNFETNKKPFLDFRHGTLYVSKRGSYQ